LLTGDSLSTAVAELIASGTTVVQADADGELTDDMVGRLRAAIAGAQAITDKQLAAKRWGAWFDATSDEELQVIFMARPDLAARLGAVLSAAGPVPEGCVDVRGVLDGVIGEAAEGSPVGASVDELQAVNRAFVRLLAAGREMLRIERTQGVSDEEAEAAIEQLDAAVSGYEPTAAPAPAQGSDERLNRAYSERNALAVAFARMAGAAGWRAGRAIDADFSKGWDDDWRHVVYVDVPGVGQVSWHMAPTDVPLLEGLPIYAGEWDGTFLARRTSWCRLSPPAASLVDAACIAIYDAVTRSNLTRDVKTDERKVAIVRGAQ
jgi:hypothetical protein